MKVPGLSVIATLNCFALLIPATLNVPLYAEFATPVVFVVLVTFRIST